MASGVRMIHIEDGSELARLLDRVDTVPLRLARNGIVYCVTREDDLWARYDPEAARQGLHAAVGSLGGLDVNELLSDPRAQRGQDTYGRPA
jgi:hypothetical protein